MGKRMFSFSNAILLFVFCNGHAQESDGIYSPFSLTCIERNGVLLTPSSPSPLSHINIDKCIKWWFTAIEWPQNTNKSNKFKWHRPSTLSLLNSSSIYDIIYIASAPLLRPLCIRNRKGKKGERKMWHTSTACACASVIMPPCHFIQVETVVHANACEVNVICWLTEWLEWLTDWMNEMETRGIVRVCMDYGDGDDST